MKKFILNLTLIAFLATALGAYAAPVSNAQIKALIRKYKAQNYTGCVQDAQTLIQKDPSNSAVYYYQGLAYYQLGKTDKATEAFEKVITLNSNSTLVEYANKGIHCINNDEECKPQPKEGEEANSELDKFLKSNKFYGNSVQADLNQKKLDQIKHNFNDAIKENEKSEMPTNDEIAEAVKTLAKVGFNPFAGMNPAAMTPESAQMMQMNMLLGNNTNNNQMNMLPMLLMNQQNGEKLSPELIQTMMMSNMANDFGYTGQTY